MCFTSPQRKVGQFYYLMKLVERMPRVCKAVIKANGGYFEESQIYFDLSNTVLAPTLFYMHYFIVLMSSLLFYNVKKNSKNKEKPLNEYVCPNF